MTKVDELFLKNFRPPYRQPETRRIEKVRELGSKLLSCLFQPGEKSCAFDANAVRNGAVGQPFLTQQANPHGLGHQLFQPGKEHIHFSFVTENAVEQGIRVHQGVTERDFIAVIVGDRRVEGNGVARRVEFAVLAHPVTEPPLAARAHAVSVSLLPFPDAGAPAVVFLKLLWGDVEPGPGLLVIDVIVLIWHDASFPP